MSGASPSSELRVIGVGLPRTGTTSLRAALERLLGAPCYNMRVLQDRLAEDGRLWGRALSGEIDVLDEILDGFVATVGWPTSLFWRELADRHPAAVLVLSRRSDAETWWRSIDRTIFTSMRSEAARADEALARLRQGSGLGEGWETRSGAMAAYEHHALLIREAIAADRLIDWTPEDGWPPLCERLGLDVPDEPFPNLNTTEEYRLATGLDAS